MSKLYDFRDYDRHMSLKISFELWLVIAYLLRPFIILFSSVRMGRGGSKNIEGVDLIKQLTYPDNFSLVLGILATVPALLFIICVMRRKPSAGNFVRQVWNKGVLLLSAATVMNIAIVFVPFLMGVISRVHIAGWMQVAISIVILIYLHRSQRVRDTFADFPVEEES